MAPLPARERGLGAEGPRVATRAHPALPESRGQTRGGGGVPSAGLEGCRSAFPPQGRITTNPWTPKRWTVSGTEGRARSADASCREPLGQVSGSGVTLNVRVPETRTVACRRTDRPEKGEGRLRGPPALPCRTAVGGGSQWGKKRPSWVVGWSWQCRGQGSAPWAVLRGPQSASIPVTPRGPAQGGHLRPTHPVSSCGRLGLDPEGALSGD